MMRSERLGCGLNKMTAAERRRRGGDYTPTGPIVATPLFVVVFVAGTTRGLFLDFRQLGKRVSLVEPAAEIDQAAALAAKRHRR